MKFHLTILQISEAVRFIIIYKPDVMVKAQDEKSSITINMLPFA